ncbi:hypothetical protein HaLaN_26695 [Haematococcus lacustris]|uniref:Uncharacterized protein n=1 Tax=Haematococcus lacustris TaxID=44745 RepID=A0A6A0A6V6_HAELA|nr:hypothetical protein HaLaN_26695 [Haematococcus lacustris]
MRHSSSGAFQQMIGQLVGQPAPAPSTSTALSPTAQGSGLCGCLASKDWMTRKVSPACLLARAARALEPVKFDKVGAESSQEVGVAPQAGLLMQLSAWQPEGAVRPVTPSRDRPSAFERQGSLADRFRKAHDSQDVTYDPAAMPRVSRSGSAALPGPVQVGSGVGEGPAPPAHHSSTLQHHQQLQSPIQCWF